MAKRTSAAVKGKKEIDSRRSLYGDILLAAEDGDLKRLDNIIADELTLTQIQDLKRAAWQVQQRLANRQSVMAQELAHARIRR